MRKEFLLTHNDRDAWASIRGYAYQIDRTLISWLRLKDNEFLELECGEDIDLLAPALMGTELERTLEQVKCLDRKVTLRSTSTRKALCAFAEHIETNPSLAVRFRFLTNALPGEETPAEPLLFVPGLKLWEEVRLGCVEVEEEKWRAAIDSIAAFLQRLDAPSEGTRSSWEKVLSLTRSRHDFSTLVSRFEWCTGAAEASHIAFDVEKLLLDGRWAATKEDAMAKHDQLFVFVMRMLSQRKAETPRRLDVSSLRNTLTSVVITSSERTVLGEIEALGNRLEAKLADMSERLIDIQQRIPTAKSQPDDSLRPVVSTSIRESLRIASMGLLAWQQETMGRWLERPELGVLEKILSTAEQSCTVLLGVPGSGKSALLARLGGRLKVAGTTLLALKTDQLPQMIANVADLDAYLELCTPLVPTVREFARAEKVVLLIDQLDSLAALMDQHTHRLNVVLQLVHQLKNTPHVHLVISCRTFDFHYDSRLASLGAAPLHLADPAFDEVRPLLLQEDANPDLWPQAMRDMLCNPQHLRVFLETFAGDKNSPIFESYQVMLEALYRKRVLEAGTANTASVCERVAASMSDSEELWIGRCEFDQRYPGEIDRLIAAGMLVERGRAIGFRHQTLFDYVRTRTFCTGASSLSTHILSRQGALFVRPIAWASLHALRASSFEHYCIEFRALWAAPGLRMHIRLLLISFLGQVAEPEVREVQWLFAALDKTRLRCKVLAAIEGNPAWFERVQSRMPSLMAENDAALQVQVSTVLRAALQFDRSTVLRLISWQWSAPEKDHLVLQTFYSFADWDEQTVAVMERILNRLELPSFHVVPAAKRAAGKQVGYGARLIKAALEGALRRGIECMEGAALLLKADGESPDDEMQDFMSRRTIQDPVRKLIDTTEWQGLAEIAQVEPIAFAMHVLPVAIRIATILAPRDNPRNTCYPGFTEVELDDEGRSRSHVLQALRLALGHWGDDDADGFLHFAEKFIASEQLIVHRLIAYGLIRAAKKRPREVLDYLISDSRRLSLGGFTDQHQETKLLIASICAQLEPPELNSLESAIEAFVFYPQSPRDSAELRWKRLRWNREHRLRLWRAIPTEKLSPRKRKLRDEEEIALPETPNIDAQITGGFLGSPLSVDKMGKAANEDILNLFAELKDETGVRHPRSSSVGGSLQASQAFGVFAKEHPGRAIAMIEMFEPGRQELPVAFALDGLEQSEYDAGLVVDLIRRLSMHGFSGIEFRERSGWVLAKLAKKTTGLPDDVCSMLESWLVPAIDPEDDGRDEEFDSSQQPQSLLFGTDRFRLLPHGNYPILKALEHGYRFRNPPAIDRWLDLLFCHLSLAEHNGVWRALLKDLSLLGEARNRGRVLSFLSAVFARYPAAIASHDGVSFVARAIVWLPIDLFEMSVQTIGASRWARREQAIGELAMLRLMINPEEEYCSRLVSNAIEIGTTQGASDLRRVGIAFVAAHCWAGPPFRDRTHPALIKLATAADGFLPDAIMSVFYGRGSLPPDAKTRELLAVVAATPELIVRGGSSGVTERLKELIADGFCPESIAAIVQAVLTAAGSAVGDIRTKWAIDAGDLIQLSITLQRFGETRESGLELFETLIDLGAYEASQVLRELDRRPL